MFKAMQKIFGGPGNNSNPMQIHAMYWVSRDKAKIIEDAFCEGDHAFELMGTTSEGEQIICVRHAQKCYVATIETDQLNVGLGKALIIKDISEVELGKVKQFVEQLREL